MLGDDHEEGDGLVIRLDDTSGNAVAAAIAAQRHKQGSPATGMVLTMLILTDEEHQADATAAAVAAAREHPMRIVTLIPRPGGSRTALDAEISVGGDNGPGEVAILRLRGELAEHANSVAVPLLLPDTPVVSYWPGISPPIPSVDPIGKHAQRRITDAANSPDPIGDLIIRAQGYQPGDTDLSWTRLTPLRSTLAATLDRPTPTIRSISIHSQADNPSATLLGVWLSTRLKCSVTYTVVDEPDISFVSLETDSGGISVRRIDAMNAILQRPGVPDAMITSRPRELSALLSEDLKRLDPDDVYGWVLSELLAQSTAASISRP